jgi:hypothetical protein
MNLPDPTYRFTRRQRRLVGLNHQLEVGTEPRQVVYTSPLLTMFSFPHRDPGEVSRYVVQNGAVTLTMQPGTALRPHGVEDLGFPFGVIPRHVMTYLVTEAVQKKSPEVFVGDSLRDFMQRLGIARNGRDAQRLKTQLERLLWCRISVASLGTVLGPDDYWYQQKVLPIATEANLWLSPTSKKGSGSGVWGSTITLSPQFYDHLIEHGPVPLYTEDLRALGDSSLRLDIYGWLVSRLYSLKRRTLIPWSDLHQQFGATYAEERAFRKRFVPALSDVLAVYTGANVTVTREHLILDRSARHLPPAISAPPRST